MIKNDVLGIKVAGARYATHDGRVVCVTLEDGEGARFPYQVVPEAGDDAPASVWIRSLLDSGGLVPEAYDGPPADELAAAAVRRQRDALLAATDYLAAPDYPLSDAGREAVGAYRQALRDITTQPGFPMAVEWPEKPAAVR